MTSQQPTPSAPPGLRVGFVPGVTLTKWRRRWAERLPGVPLQVVEVGEDEQRRVLDERRVDMCFVRLPVERDGLHVIRLYDEVAVVVMPADHPLAERDEVASADLEGETPVAGDAEASAVERVSWGAGVARMPHSVARSHSRSDVVARPISDAEPTTVALAWLADDPPELAEEFIGIVRGRTANSSRTTAERAKAEPTSPPKRRDTPAKGARKATPRGRGRRR